MSRTTFEPNQTLMNLIGRHEGCTGAIIGSGTSLEGFDYTQIDEHEPDGRVIKIGMNESCKLLRPDYLCIMDHNGYRKTWEIIDQETTLILGRSVWSSMRQAPHFNPRTQENALDKLRELREFVAVKYQSVDIDEESLWASQTILTGALSLAVCLGLRRVFLYGCDFYRRFDREYAYDIGASKQENLEELPGGRYTTPSYRAMKNAIERNVKVWEDLEVVNMSKRSELKCFPIGAGAL